jgi:flagellar motor switch protein FliN
MGMTEDLNPQPLVPAPLGDEPAPEHEPVAANVGQAHDGDDLGAVWDVPVKVQVLLGRSRMEIGELMRMKAGDIVELDRRVGEPVDVFVNNRMIARGEVVLIDHALGVTLTEIVRQDR